MQVLPESEEKGLDLSIYKINDWEMHAILIITGVQGFT